MKVLAGLVFTILCIASALCQTTSVSSCLQANLATASQRLPSECTEATNGFITMIGGGVASNDALEMACNNNCSRMLDNILVDECGVSLLNIVCAQDSEGFCFSTASSERQQMQTANLISACFNTDCSNNVCNSAVNSLSCCVSTNLEFAQLLGGSSLSIDVAGCTLPAACGGGMAVFAMPAALLTALIAALAAIF